MQSFLNQQQPPPPANRLNQSNNSNQTSRQSNSNTGNYALPYDVLPSQCRDNNGNSNGNLNPNSLQSTTNLINSVASVTFQQQPQHHQQSQSIYGQRLGGVTSTSNAVSSIIKSLPLPIGTNQGCNVTPASNASCQQNGLIEPLYATTKLINGSRGSNGTNTANITFNYCPKVRNELLLFSSSIFKLLTVEDNNEFFSAFSAPKMNRSKRFVRMRINVRTQSLHHRSHHPHLDRIVPIMSPLCQPQ